MIALMYISMGYTMLNLPLPLILKKHHLVIAFMQMLLAIVVMIINRKFFISGIKALKILSPNMDSLVSLGAIASFAYSVAVVFKMLNSTAMDAHMLFDDLYFDSSAMILTLITMGKYLEAKAKGKTTDALKSLMKLSPKTACVLREDKEYVVPVEEVKINDIFVVKAGELIPVDGRVVYGESAVDESILSPA